MRSKIWIQRLVMVSSTLTLKKLGIRNSRMMHPQARETYKGDGDYTAVGQAWPVDHTYAPHHMRLQKLL